MLGNGVRLKDSTLVCASRRPKDLRLYSCRRKSLYEKRNHKGDAGEYYYVSENGESVEIDGKEYYPLKQNDNVIVYGTNLFNGKIYK